MKWINNVSGSVWKREALTREQATETMASEEADGGVERRVSKML